MLKRTALAIALVGAVASLLLAAPGTSDEPDAAKPDAQLDAARKLFPYVRLHVQERWVEFDGFVPIDVNDPDAPHVYLEQVACGRESPEIAAGKEHESLVATSAKGSHIHAALLLLGLEPGKPVTWHTNEDGSIGSTVATGPRLRVEFRWKDEQGNEHAHPPQHWICHVQTREAFAEGDWVFSGSLFVTRQGAEVYDADRSGTLIGLSSFGTEVISWPKPIHHESGIEEPVWIARNEAVPPFKTPVTVRLFPVEDEPADPKGDSPSSETGN